MKRIVLCTMILYSCCTNAQGAYIPSHFISVIRNSLDHPDFQQALWNLGERIGNNLNLSLEQKQQFCDLLRAYREVMKQHAALSHDHEACESAEQRFYEVCETIWPEGSQEEVELEELVDTQLSEQYESRLLLHVIDAVLKELA